MAKVNVPDSTSSRSTPDQGPRAGHEPGPRRTIPERIQDLRHRHRRTFERQARTSAFSVDGVMLVAEHGDYPKSDTGQKVFPKRRDSFEEVVEVFQKQQAGRAGLSPTSTLPDNWEDAKWFYDTAKELEIPLMGRILAAGSVALSPGRCKTKTGRGKLKEIVAVSYGSLDAYGFSRHGGSAMPRRTTSRRRENGDQASPLHFRTRRLDIRSL